MRFLLLIYTLFFFIIPALADGVYDEFVVNPNKAGGVYYAYPVTSRNDTPVPIGYTPFYISHIGRHGSRYLLKESDYTNPLHSLKLAHDNDALTTYGKFVYRELEALYSIAKDRAGDLTEIGVLQHKQIAKRMVYACPEVFVDTADIIAHSTMAMRCAMSMAAFTEALKEENPNLRIIRDPSEKHVKYLNYQSSELKSYNDPNGTWQKEYREYRKSHTPHKTFIPRLFSDIAFISKHINPVNFTCQMYNIAVGVQNLSEKFKFIDLFTIDELFELWKIYNFRMYAHYSNYSLSDGVVLKNSIPLLRNIVERAEFAIQSNRTGVDLRFGHDINIIPLTGLIGFDGCDKIVNNPNDVHTAFQDYRISPMASNIQIVFYKNAHNNIIVKFLLNEQETKIPCKTTEFPYYDWEDVKEYFCSKF